MEGEADKSVGEGFDWRRANAPHTPEIVLELSEVEREERKWMLIMPSV